MKPNPNGLMAVVILLLAILAGCGDDATENHTTVSANFESGSIGQVIEISRTEWEFFIANDNNNAELPDSWRSWWYVKMENPVRDAPTQITIKNSGWPYYYVPIYSYDQRNWHHFADDEVTQNQNNEIVLKKQYARDTVWIARFYPYTFTDLEHYVRTLRASSSPYLDIQAPGYSQEGKPLYLFRITNFSVPVERKKRILIHARTHPAETPPSFLIEGMMEYLLSGSQQALHLLSEFEFHIFPMQNVDGVIAGNYRATPRSENLEVMWSFDRQNPLYLTGEIPPEVAIIHQYAVQLMTDGGPPVSMALNLHASNSEPDIRPFFFPHFGTIDQGYSATEASLWARQIRLIDTLAVHYGADLLEPVPVEGGGSFASKTYPESWWWANYQDQVIAMTMEMTYGRAGYAPRWIEPDDFRHLGASLAWRLLIMMIMNPGLRPGLPLPIGAKICAIPNSIRHRPRTS